MIRKAEQMKRLVVTTLNDSAWLEVLREFGDLEEYDAEKVGNYLTRLFNQRAA